MLLLYGQFLPLYCKYLLYLFKCSYVGYIYIDNCYIFLFEKPFYHYIMSVSCKISILKSILSDISIATLRLFFVSIPWNIFLHHSSFFSLCVSLYLKWVSYRQYIYIDFVFYPFSYSGLLIAEFSPIIFKVVTDNHLLMPFYCFLIVLQFIFVPFTFA